jgi:putative molybdopterin biosynthesis protein
MNISMTDRVNKIEVLSSLDQINVLSDSRRLDILQILMVKPRTISQIGRELGEYPAAIRYHIQRLEDSGLVELNELRESPGYTEKYYSAKAQAVLLRSIILPRTVQKRVVFMGSHDLALERLTIGIEKRNPDISILTLPIGSIDGLVALRQGAAHFTGCHLFDADTGQFNRPYIRHFFPDRKLKLITLAHRTQGIIVAPRNPKQISRLDDLARKDITFINRNRGSGTRIWLDSELRKLGLETGDINGYTQEVHSHSGITKAIKFGTADLGIGLIAAAVERELDYIPLFEEQYDLVFPESQVDDTDMQTMLNYLTTANFRKSISSLAGYTTTKTGDSLEV